MLHLTFCSSRGRPPPFAMSSPMLSLHWRCHGIYVWEAGLRFQLALPPVRNAASSSDIWFLPDPWIWVVMGVVGPGSL